MLYVLDRISWFPPTPPAPRSSTLTPEPNILDDFAHTQGLANPGSIQPHVRPGVYLDVGKVGPPLSNQLLASTRCKPWVTGGCD